MTEGSGGSPSETVTTAAALVLRALAPLADRDWSVRAGELAWSCRQTADHVVDCVLSFCLQLAARRKVDWLPLEEVHARADAAPGDLLDAMAAASRSFSALLAATAPDATASDGVVELGPADWAARGAYEMVVHGHDIASGLGGVLDPPAALCTRLLGSPALWMLDRDRAALAAEPWDRLLAASGRAARSS